MGNDWKRVQTSANEWGNEWKRMKNDWKHINTGISNKVDSP